MTGTRVVPLHREAAYTPLDRPTTCMTPGHHEREARNYPGGRLCEPCISASRRNYVNRNDNGGDPR